jgi:hypothetical protein
MRYGAMAKDHRYEPGYDYYDPQLKNAQRHHSSDDWAGYFMIFLGIAMIAVTLYHSFFSMPMQNSYALIV